MLAVGTDGIRELCTHVFCNAYNFILVFYDFVCLDRDCDCLSLLTIFLYIVAVSFICGESGFPKYTSYIFYTHLKQMARKPGIVQNQNDSDEEDDIEFVFEQTETENCFYITKYAAEE